MKQCIAISAATLLKRVLSGYVEGSICVLCLCDESVLATSQVIGLDSGSTMTISKLLEELHLDGVSENIHAKKICRCCVEQMKKFYLFKTRCFKSMQSLQNLVNILESEVTKSSAQFIEIHCNESDKYALESMMNIKVELDAVYKPKNMPIECLKCYSNFSTIEEMTSHQKVHGRSPYYICRKCDQTWNGYQSFQDHCKSDHPECSPPHQLILLNISDCHKSKLNVPVKAELDEKEWCKRCDAEFFNIFDLKAHHCILPTDIIEKQAEVKTAKVKKCTDPNKFKPNSTKAGRQKIRKHLEQSVSGGIAEIEMQNENDSNSDFIEQMDEELDIFDKSKEYAIDDDDSPEDWFEKYFPKNNRLQRVKKKKAKNEYASENIDQLRNKFGLFECRKCYLDFETIKEWSQHQKEHGRSPYHHCRLCDETFNGFKGLIEHCTSTHPNNVLPTPILKLQTNMNEHCICNYCNKTFRNKQCLLSHIVRKHCEAIKPHVCKICNMKFIDGHNCRFACSDCSVCPCLHQPYLQLFMEEELKNPQSIHSCKECHFEYKNRSELIDHVNRQHLLILPHLCSYCGLKLPSKKALRIHIANSHPSNYCPHCNRGVPKQRYERHIAECKNIVKPYGCNVCERLFASERMAEVHRKSHNSGVKCKTCGYLCQSRYELTQHKIKCRNSDANDENVPVETAVTFPCLKCTLDFSTEADSIVHEMTHLPDVGYLCRECNQTYPTRAERFECLRTHKGDATEMCPICGRLFQKLCLPVHMKRHASRGEVERLPQRARKVWPKTHMCDVCGSMHTTAINLKRHKERHKPQEKCSYCLKYIEKRLMHKHIAIHNNGMNGSEKSKPLLNCKECNYSTQYRYIFESHLNKVHRKIKPYECDICGKKYHSKGNLKCHKTTHVKKLQRCEECDQNFFSAKGFKLHMMAHRGELPYSCSRCDFKFVSASRLREHENTTHLGVQYKCTFCEKAFTRRQTMTKHVSVAHQGGGRSKKTRHRLSATQLPSIAHSSFVQFRGIS